jgi:hypothetical protein
MSALGGFDQTMALGIKRKYEAKGGVGVAKEVLGRWGSSNHENNVGALKKIVEDTMGRVDVLDEIERWEKLSVCHGCGIKLRGMFSFAIGRRMVTICEYEYRSLDTLIK